MASLPDMSDKGYVLNSKTYSMWLDELCKKWSLRRSEFKFKECKPGLNTYKFTAICTIQYDSNKIVAIGQGMKKKSSQHDCAYRMLLKFELSASDLANMGKIIKPEELLRKLSLEENEKNTEQTWEQVVEQFQDAGNNTMEIPEADLQILKKYVQEKEAEEKLKTAKSNTFENPFRAHLTTQYSVVTSMLKLSTTAKESLSSYNWEGDGLWGLINSIACDLQNSGIDCKVTTFTVSGMNKQEQANNFFTFLKLKVVDISLVFVGKNVIEEKAREDASTKGVKFILEAIKV